MQTLVHRAVANGRLRADVTGADITLLATQVAALDADGTARTEELRRRYIGLALQGLALTNAPPLPGPAPDAAELERTLARRRLNIATSWPNKTNWNAVTETILNRPGCVRLTVDPDLGTGLVTWCDAGHSHPSKGQQ